MVPPVSVEVVEETEALMSSSDKETEALMSSSDKSMLVEHVSQLSQPHCKFCLKSTLEPGHSDCSRFNVFTGGKKGKSN